MTSCSPSASLADTDDDVRSVSASCLLPVADYLVASLPDELYRVLDVLWEALAEGGDELGSSTGVIMTLLSASPSSVFHVASGAVLTDCLPPGLSSLQASSSRSPSASTA